MAEENGFLYYKGRPLVRCGDVIYYGNTSEKCIIRMDIISKKSIGKLKCADKVSVKLIKTDDIKADSAIKEGERLGLYNALDLGYVWLNKELS